MRYRLICVNFLYAVIPKPGLSDMWQCPVKGYSLLDKMTSRNLSTCGGCECPVNLILGPVIRTPLLDQISIQLQFTWETLMITL